MKFSLFMLPCFRAGVAPSLAQFYEELAELVRYADTTGWDRAWLSEHHFHYYGGASPNPAQLLTAWARETTRIRLGSGISLLPLRNPLHVAEEFALLDQLSGGRLDFGVGRGYLPHEFAGHGVTAEEATGRREEAFDIVMRAWQGAPFAYEGRHNRFPLLQVTPTPLQQPVPVWVACSRTRESFEWAGRNGYAMMMNHYPQSRAQAAERFAWYRDTYAAAGHDPARREAMMSVFLYLADSAEQAVDEARMMVQEHANLYRLLFQGDQWNEDYAGDASVFDFLAPDGDVAGMFAERTCIGTPAQAVERIVGWREMGFTEISFVVRTGALSHAATMRTMARFNDAVLPAFAAARAAVPAGRQDR